jgi:outer membrane protein OmpA-like peptidoglycan-associated protein
VKIAVPLLSEFVIAGDCVVQNGTRHAWNNQSSEKLPHCVLPGGSKAPLKPAGLRLMKVSAFLLAWVLPANPTGNEPSPKPAYEYVVRAFDRYPLVALSEWHGARETMYFVKKLIRTDAFAGRVNDIVVEFGNARYQQLMDRYIAGEDVARDALKQVWENTTQVSGVWSSPIYEEFFADVRAFNQSAPSGKRVRVLLGDPPIDWKSVTGPADEDMNDWRDAHLAWVVEQQVMRKGHKALLFVGGAHISRRVILPNSLIELLDRRFPGKALVISTVQIPTVRGFLANMMGAWPIPSAAEIRNTTLGDADVHDVGFGLLSVGLLQDDIDVVLVLSKDRFSDVPVRIDPNSAYAVELKRRQTLQDATMPFRGGRIRFEKGSFAVTKDSETALASVQSELQRDTGLRLIVKAFADSTEAQALTLSKGRAERLVDWLVQRGIDRRRLAPLGCGSSRPMWNSDSEEHRAANRRAELVRRSEREGCQPPDSFEWR